MPTVIQKLVFPFPSVTGRAQTQFRQINMGSNVITVFAALAGFEIQYNNGDHHILAEEIQVDVTSTNGPVVGVTATFLLRDGSGNIDDPYSGFISALVIANV